ncbi:MAG: GtrA family protein [Patescibacteria group bacterium]
MIKHNFSLPEFLKFTAAGVLNTAIDFAVLNLLIQLFGLGIGDVRYPIFKIISFVIAVTNSFFVNKFWVFRSKTLDTAEEMTKFLSVSLIGLLLNTAISSYIFKIGPEIVPWSETAWVNIGALVGTIFVLGWNFVGYKLFVFSSSKEKAVITK